MLDELRVEVDSEAGNDEPGALGKGSSFETVGSNGGATFELDGA